MRLLETLLTSFIFVLVYLLLLVYFLLSIENPKKIVNLFIISFVIFLIKNPKIGTMAQKKLGEYATPNDDYLRAPITQPAVIAENYKLRLTF